MTPETPAAVLARGKGQAVGTVDACQCIVRMFAK
jgi:hypothetical protein